MKVGVSVEWNRNCSTRLLLPIHRCVIEVKDGRAQSPLTGCYVFSTQRPQHSISRAGAKHYSVTHRGAGKTQLSVQVEEFRLPLLGHKSHVS